MSAAVFWPLVFCLVGALIVQGILLRNLHQRRLQALRTKHHEVLSSLHDEFEQMTVRMRQLQRAQDSQTSATVRFDAAVRKSDELAMSARQALERELDDASEAHRAPPSDGFADTEVLAHEAQPSSLLLQ